MAQPSLIYFAADADRRLIMRITKDLQFALAVEQEVARRPLCIVYVEELPTMKEAVERLAKITRMSIARRRKLVERKNPEWKALRIDIPVPVTPSGAEAPSVRMPFVGPLTLGELPRDYPSQGDDASGGVLSKIPIPVRPRSGQDAKPWPPE